ncbi:MAG: thiamine pyrophosphate-binding protein, partial [Desulfobacula sp.]|nr:thiamine pyrophosphate-binding protein [Desulfobacula sp.]
MITVARQFSETLKEIGIRYVFGVPSGSMIDYIEAIRKTGKIDFILVSHEASAGFMAYVCGRLTGIPGACFATFGPGATNLSTGVGGALLDRSPLLAFTDEMPEEKRHRTVQMNIDHQAFFKPITKWTTRLKTGTVRETLLEAARIAGSGIPGPVHVGIPSDISNKKSQEDHIQLTPLPKRKPAALSVIQTMQEMFSRACNPLIVLGITAVQTDVKSLIHEVIEKFRLPVILTPMAKGMVSEDHPSYAGVLNHALANIVSRTYQQADLILGIGYDPVEVNYEDWVSDAPIIHINTVPVDLDTDSHTIAADVVGDIKISLQSLMTVSHLNNKWDMDAVLKQKQKMFATLQSCEGSFGPLAVLEGLR